MVMQHFQPFLTCAIKKHDEISHFCDALREKTLAILGKCFLFKEFGKNTNLRLCFSFHSLLFSGTDCCTNFPRELAKCEPLIARPAANQKQGSTFASHKNTMSWQEKLRTNQKTRSCGVSIEAASSTCANSLRLSIRVAVNQELLN